MNMVKILIGLPGAGKSSWAAQYLNTNTPNETVIISLDSIREMLFGKYCFVDRLESLVRGIAYHVMRSALHAKLDIIIDDTNLILTKADREMLVYTLRALEHHTGVLTIEAICFPYTDECKYRRMHDNRGLGASRWEKLIDEMLERYQPIMSAYELKQGVLFDDILLSSR
jgi:predicted kinase